MEFGNGDDWRNIGRLFCDVFHGDYRLVYCQAGFLTITRNCADIPQHTSENLHIQAFP